MPNSLNLLYLTRNTKHMNLKLALILALCAVSMLTKSEAADGLTLVKDGQPSATIVLGQQPTSAAQLAAFELQSHIKEMTGASLPVVKEDTNPTGTLILVGDSAKARALGVEPDSFKSQEFAVRFFPDAVVLQGRDKADTGKVIYGITDPNAALQSWPGIWDERGTLDATYEFLERFCGVRWFNPTESGTDLPKSLNLVVSGADVRRAPSFEYRDALAARNSLGDGYDASVGLWKKDSNEFNAWESVAYPGLHKAFPNAQQYLLAKRATVRLFQLRRREGGTPARCNHSLYGFYDNKAFEEHPEWFAKGYRGGKPPQLCYSNEGLIEQVAQDALSYLSGRKTGKELGIFWNPVLPNPFPVEPMDNSSFCKCPQCRALIGDTKLSDEPSYYSSGLHSDYFFGFVNAVAKRVRETDPNGRLITLAYKSHAAPPKTLSLEPSVTVEFCFASNRMPYQEEYAHEMDLLEQWSKQERPLYMWLYNTFPTEIANNGKFHCWPGFFAHTMAEQMKRFHQLGVRGFFHCGFGQEVEAYLTYKFMDNVDLNVDDELKDYFTRMYGPAGKSLQEFYGLVEEAYCNPANYDKKDRHQTMQIAWEKLGTPERMSQLKTLMEQAKAAPATDLQKQRVALFEKGVWDYMVAGRNQYLERTGSPIPSATVPRCASGAPDWSKAVALGPWHSQNSREPAAREFTARAAHDGKFLYLQLTDPADPAKLQNAGMVFPFDTWEIFAAAQRALPYRHFAINQANKISALSNGEINWRMGVPMEELDIEALTDTAAKDRWVTRIKIPLASLTEKGVATGDKFYMNIVRVSSPQVTGGATGIDTWVAFSKVNEVDRLAEITLAP